MMEPKKNTNNSKNNNKSCRARIAELYDTYPAVEARTPLAKDVYLVYVNNNRVMHVTVCKEITIYVFKEGKETM